MELHGSLNGAAQENRPYSGNSQAHRPKRLSCSRNKRTEHACSSALNLQMSNKNGKFVSPSETTFAAAAAGADWFSVPGMGISLVEQKGDAAWPITGASFVLMYKQPTDKAASKEVVKFFTWAFKDGQQLALDLDYVPLPDALTKQIASKVWSQIKH
jgi:hypothetical protein